jgi:Type II secretion system (T2SS), protein M
MTNRDRMVIIGLSVLAILAAGWILVVSPERQQASKLQAQVSSAQSELSSAEGKLSTARAAQSQYASAYDSIVSLGKAVPPSQEVPSLIYELAQATGQKNVEFSSIAAGGGSSASASAAASAGAGAAANVFTAMPFTFIFNGSFFNLEHLFERIDGFATSNAAGSVKVSGRLLTIQSIKLSPLDSSGAKGSSGLLSGTITATAYELPAGQGLTGSGTTAAAGGVAPATTSGASSSPTPAATVSVNP